MSTPTKRELLVRGFLREIENIFKNNKIISLDVIRICFCFYSIPSKLFIFFEQTKIFDYNSVVKKSLSKLCHANIDKKSISNFVGADQHILSACYAPNISSCIDISQSDVMMNKNKHYDGIVAIKYTNSEWCTAMSGPPMDYYLSVILFESNQIENETIDYYLFQCKHKIKQDGLMFNMMHFDIQYCNDKHGVIYESMGQIHQLKLENINLQNLEFNVNSIPIPNNDNVFQAIYNNYCNDLSIGYIHYENKLFGIEGHFGQHVTQQNIKQETMSKCAVFDLNKLEWKSTKELKYNKYDEQCWVKHGICKNNKYDTNIVYTVSNIGHTAKYDLNKDEWIMLLEDIDGDEIRYNRKSDKYDYDFDILYMGDRKRTSTTKPTVWLDDNPHILYCSHDSYFEYFDVRNNQKKWIQNNNLEIIYNKVDNQSFTLFL